MGVADSIDQLSGALVAAGVEAPIPPSDLGPLYELEAVIAPFQVPAEVRRFWERVEPRSLRVGTRVRLIAPVLRAS